MRINTEPDDPPRMPCIRDYAELVNVHLPPPVILKALPFGELERRCDELVAEYPHLREETPVVLSIESSRRKRLQGLKIIVNHEQASFQHA